MLAGGCGRKDEDPNWRVNTYGKGQLEADLRRDVGPPTRERPVVVGDKAATCALIPDGEAVRELTYDIPSAGAAKRAREMFGMAPSHSFVVCVDRAGRILGVVNSEVH